MINHRFLKIDSERSSEKYINNKLVIVFKILIHLIRKIYNSYLNIEIKGIVIILLYYYVLYFYYYKIIKIKIFKIIISLHFSVFPLFINCFSHLK